MISAQVHAVLPSVVIFIALVHAPQRPLCLQDQQLFAQFEGEFNY